MTAVPGPQSFYCSLGKSIVEGGGGVAIQRLVIRHFGHLVIGDF